MAVAYPGGTWVVLAPRPLPVLAVCIVVTVPCLVVTVRSLAISPLSSRRTFATVW
jgi:hypothetical protein